MECKISLSYILNDIECVKAVVPRIWETERGNLLKV